jgi:ribonuclease HI
MVQDPEPAGSPRVRVAAGSQLPKVSPASESQGETNSDTALRHPEAFSDPGSHEPLGSEPMEVDEPDRPGRGCTIQCPVYYVSEVLHDVKTRYLEVHKLLYAVLIASRKLCHYFQAHKISVVTSYPLRAVLDNPNATDNIAKWAAELAEFELDFVTRHVIKNQVLTDFVADWTPPPSLPREPDGSTPEPPAPAFTSPHCTLFFDGSSRNQAAGAGALLLTLVGEQFKYMVHLEFKATNNMAEYEALIFRLSTALPLGVRQLLVKGDSQLIIKQVKGECCCNDPQLAAYLLHVRKLEKDFEVLDLHHISHAEHAAADDLSTKASTWVPVPDGVFERRLQQPTARPTEPSKGGETSTSRLAISMALIP